jgi:AcrR family transcriptional regulator
VVIESPANARSRRTRHALLGAAREILDSEGFERLTMAAVAERAGVTRRAVYLHFPSRTDLVSALFTHVAEEEGLAESLQPVFDAPDAISALQEWSRHLARYGLRLLPVTRAIERSHQNDADVAQYREQIAYAQRESCRVLAARLEREGLLAAPWTVETATDMLWVLASGDVTGGLLVERGWSTERYVEHLSTLLRSTFVAHHSEFVAEPENS